MAYIQPNTDIYLLKNVPLDKDYQHTLFFKNKGEQRKYFLDPLRPDTPLKFHLTNYTYQREGINKLRVAKPAQDLYDCNYLVFTNTSFGGKLFFAFIDKPAEYVSNTVSEITYTIDKMQTWYFDYDLGECLIEREHTETDGLGENIVPENLDCGELIINDVTEYDLKGDDYCKKGTAPEDPLFHDNFNPAFYCLIYYVANLSKGSGSSHPDTFNVTTAYPRDDYPKFALEVSTDNVTNITYKNGEIMGCRVTAFPFFSKNFPSDSAMSYKSAKIFGEIIQAMVDATAEIVQICLVPTKIYRNNFETATLNIRKPNGFKNLAGVETYIPKNNKLFTSPYISLTVSNNTGKTATFKWEDFSVFSNQDIVKLKIDLSAYYQPEALIYPENYRGKEKDYESGISASEFPTPAWSVDSFSKWWAQNKNAYVTSMISTSVLAITSIVLAIATAGASTAAQLGAAAAVATTTASGATTFANSIGSLKTAKNTPDQISGQVTTTTLKNKEGRYSFIVYSMAIKPEMAKIIDDYFTWYGYKVNAVKVPNIKNPAAKLRPHWNYIKTSSCLIHHSANSCVPADDEKAISEIYNRGITFWMDANEVGDYSLDNRPI